MRRRIRRHLLYAYTRFHPIRGWLEPEHLGCNVNSAGDEFSPSYVAAGRPALYFSSKRSGLDNIYRSVRQPTGGWGPPEPVAELNFAGFATARPSVRRDGRTIAFDSNRPGGLGCPDIWVSTRPDPSATWSDPVNLGPNVNSPFAETRAFIFLQPHPLPPFLGGGGHPNPKLVMTAHGTLENGRRFQFHLMRQDLSLWPHPSRRDGAATSSA